MEMIAKICVSVVCGNDSGEYLMVKENRNGVITYNVPTGAVELNETIEMAASREMQEETGISLVNIVHLGTTVLKPRPIKDSTVQQKSYLTLVYGVDEYMCEYDAKLWSDTNGKSAKIVDGDVVEARWMSISEILSVRHMWRNELIEDKIIMYNHNKRIKHFKNINMYAERYM